MRRLLYLAAISATRCNADMKAFYGSLIDMGKPKKLAIIAVTRKLIVLANTLVAQGRHWLHQPPIHA